MGPYPRLRRRRLQRLILRPPPTKNHGSSVQALRACYLPGIQGRRNAEECDRRAERRRGAEKCDFRAKRRRDAEKCDCRDERCFERLAGRARYRESPPCEAWAVVEAAQ